MASFPLLAQQDLAHFRFRIVDHPAVVVEHHCLAPRRVERLPDQPRLAGIARASEISPGRGHLLRQRLRFRPVAGPLFAAFRVVEATYPSLASSRLFEVLAA
jgi:hypothetical protein